MAIRHQAVSETVSSAQTEQPHTNGKVNGSASNGSYQSEADRLMKQMGSKKGFDPIPPDQYLYFLNDRDPLQRLLAWVRSKTIRHGHRSPYCVDEHGQPLTLDHIMAHFGWKNRHTRATWEDAETKGLVHKDDEGRLCLSGNVPPAPTLEAEPDEPEKFCTELFPQYLSEQFQQLSPDQQERFKQTYPSYCRLKDRVKADAIALARELEDKLSEQFFGQFGMKERRYGSRRESEGHEIVSLSLGDLPDEFTQVFKSSVQNFSKSVQTEKSTLYNPKNGSVQDAPSLCISEDRDTEEKNGRGGLFSVAAEENKKTAPPPQSSSTIAVPEPEREQAWETFRLIMDACGKPVSVAMSGVCRAEFFKYPAPVQERIVEDAAIRAEQIWNEPKWTPAPLKYLQSRIWETEPVKRRSLPVPGNSRQQQRNEAIQRLYAQSAARTHRAGESS